MIIISKFMTPKIKSGKRTIVLTPQLKPRYSLLDSEKVAYDFYKKNNLPKPDMLKTKRGIVMNFGRKGTVLLSVDYSQEGSLFQPVPYIGGNVLHASTSGKYILEGKLNKKNIELEAEVTITTDFKDGSPDFKNSRINKCRKDKEDYWFITRRK